MFRRILRFNLRTFFVVFTISVCVIWWWAETPSRSAHRFARLLEEYNPDTEVVRITNFGKRSLVDVWAGRQGFEMKFVVTHESKDKPWKFDCHVRFSVDEDGRIYIWNFDGGPRPNYRLLDYIDPVKEFQKRVDPVLISHGSVPSTVGRRFSQNDPDLTKTMEMGRYMQKLSKRK